MSDSELSSLSSSESLELEENPKSTHRGTLEHYFKNAKPPTQPKRKRPASPPHEYVLADNPDIAFIVMFRARFNDVFPKSLPNFGPQDIERGVVSTVPDDSIEKLLCALIGLALNRKKDVEKGHYSRALEEAISTYSNQWPSSWGGKNPLSGGGSFDAMNPEQRLVLLKTVILWSLQFSEIVKKTIAEAYKGQRYEGDIYQERAVQSWGSDGENRKYWLIEGLDDTYFRVYRESNPALKTRTWWSVADSIESVRVLAGKLREDGSQKSGRLANSIELAIPRFEAGEDKRKRREYRQARKAQFKRAEPGLSLYEGRTRGKRVRYNFSDDEEGGSDTASGRPSRNSGISTPAEPAGPVVTASGRHIRPRAGGIYGESLLSGQQEEVQESFTNGVGEDHVTQELASRTRAGRGGATSRAGRSYHQNHNAVDDMEDESDAPSSEWDSGKEEDDNADVDMGDDQDGDEETSDDDMDEDDIDLVKGSMLVKLKINKFKTEAEKHKASGLIARDEPLLTNGASPAGSTIVLHKDEAQEHKANGEHQVGEDAHSMLLSAPSLKPEFTTPDAKPIQSPTPPLSDPLHARSIEG